MNPEVAEKYGVQMKKTGEVTLESEFEKIKKVSMCFINLKYCT